MKNLFHTTQLNNRKKRDCRFQLQNYDKNNDMFGAHSIHLTAPDVQDIKVNYSHISLTAISLETLHFAYQYITSTASDYNE